MPARARPSQAGGTRMPWRGMSLPGASRPAMRSSRRSTCAVRPRDASERGWPGTPRGTLARTRELIVRVHTGEARLVPIRASDRLQAVETTAGVLCRRWKPALLWLLASGCRRYTQLAARLPGISPKVLTQHLRELERDGLLTRDVATQGRKRVDYTLTPLGEELRPLLKELERWGRAYRRERPAAEAEQG